MREARHMVRPALKNGSKSLTCVPVLRKRNEREYLDVRTCKRS